MLLLTPQEGRGRTTHTVRAGDRTGGGNIHTRSLVHIRSYGVMRPVRPVLALSAPARPALTS
jgi:hypothetical protein